MAHRCAALLLARHGLIAILALQEIIKSLVIGRQPAEVEWETARVAVDLFTGMAAPLIEKAAAFERDRVVDSTAVDIN